MKIISMALATMIFALTNTASAQTTLLELISETGDSLMLHRLNNGEIWGSFMITDQVVDSFAVNELIVLQVDKNQPIKLDHEKRCNTPAGESQKVSYDFQAQQDQDEWLFSRVNTNKPDILKLTGWDKDIYAHMRSDRRPEVVDFPIQGELALEGLLQQFKHGQQVTFRYTTEAGESRQAQFSLERSRDKF